MAHHRAVASTALAVAMAVLLVVAPSARPAAALEVRDGSVVGLQTRRIAGDDRIATAVATATLRGPVGVLFIANADAFPDALAGAAGAAQGYPPRTSPTGNGAGALLLPVHRDAVPDAVGRKIQDLEPQRIVVVGGPAVVSDGVLAQLRGYAPRVDRIGGADRYETSARVATEVAFPSQLATLITPSDRTGEVLLASGEDFPDALVAAQAAKPNTKLVLLTARGGLPPATAAALRATRPTSVVVLGGTAAVSDAVLAQVRAIVPDAPVERVAGEDRYETAALLMDRTYLSAPDTYLASGEVFPDALYAGANLYGALHLTRRDCLPPGTVDGYRRVGVVAVTAVGGTAVVSDGALAGRTC